MNTTYYVDKLRKAYSIKYEWYYTEYIILYVEILEEYRVPPCDACFVGSALGVYARWSKMGAGDLSLLI